MTEISNSKGEESLEVQNENVKVNVSQCSVTATVTVSATETLIKGNVEEEESRVLGVSESLIPNVEEKLEIVSNGVNPSSLGANQNQNVGSFVSEVEMKVSDGSCNQDAIQNEGSSSRINLDDPKVGSLVVDLNPGVATVAIEAGDGIDGKAEGGDCPGIQMVNATEKIEGIDQQQHANQSMGSCSRITFDESNMNSLVVDLNSAFKTCSTEDRDSDQTGHCVGKQQVETEEQIPGIEQPKGSEFAFSDLVWGKVKSHPWWPGQIFDPSYASENALKHYKKGTFLVAYFGDQSFAWNDSLSLKPFKANYSQMAKQTNMVAFRDAIDCALEEVSRRVVLGLSCSCTPEEIYAARETQWIVNSGIQENVCIRDGVDRFFSVTSFEPEKIIQYINALALNQCHEGDSMELAMVKGQVEAFYGSKGYFQLPEFHVSEGLSGVAEPVMPVYEKEEKAHVGKGRPRSQQGTFIKQQSVLEDNFKSKKRERSLTELLKQNDSSSCFVNGADERDGSKSELTSGKKRKATESSSNDTTGKSKRKRLGPSKISSTESPTSRASNVGERFCSIAKQMAGSPPVLKCDGEKFLESAVKVDCRKKKLHEVDVGNHVSCRTSGGKTSVQKGCLPDEMLSQLCLTARDPMKGYSFLTAIVDFFTGFRNSISGDGSSSTKRKKPEKKLAGGETSVRNRKASNSKASSSESYGYGAVADSYWTDRIIQNSSEEQSSRKRQKRKVDPPLDTTLKDEPTFEANASHDLDLISGCKKDPDIIEPTYQVSPIEDAKQKGLDENSNLIAEKSVGSEKSSEDFSPTALTLNFTDADSIPLELDLNKIFSGFGTLRESETEILRKTKRARVVFERRSDADEAFRRACKYSVFGPALVSYKLTSWPSTPAKASRCSKRHIRETATSTGGNKK